MSLFHLLGVFRSPAQAPLTAKAAYVLSVILVSAGCSAPLVSINANSSADKTDTNTENYSAQFENNDSSSLATAPPPPQPRVNTAPPASQTVQRPCIVNDANDTYANLRQSPNGALIGPVNNGTSVWISGSQTDVRGREWALVRTQSNQTGFIFRALVTCS